MQITSKFNYETDENLVWNIQNSSDKKIINASFEVIKNRHSGAFIKTAQRWINRHQPTEFDIEPEYIMQSKDFVLFDSVRTFNLNKKAKLVTYITNKTMWFCSTSVKTNRKNKSKVMDIDSEDLNQSNKTALITPDSDWEEHSMQSLFCQKIDEVLKRVGGKAELIFRIRHLGAETRKWKEVSEILKEKHNITLCSNSLLQYQSIALKAIKEEITNNKELSEYNLHTTCQNKQ